MDKLTRRFSATVFMNVKVPIFIEQMSRFRVSGENALIPFLVIVNEISSPRAVLQCRVVCRANSDGAKFSDMCTIVLNSGDTKR